MNRHERRAAAKNAAKSADKSGDRSLGARPVEDIAAVQSAIIGELRAGRYLEAQLKCQRALDQNPEHPELLHLMALVCFNAKAFDHAAEWAAHATKRDPKPAYLTTLGAVLLNLRRLDEGVGAFEQAARLKTDDAGLWSNLGNACVEAGRATQAIESFERALAIDPNHLDATFKLGVLMEQRAQYEEALLYLNRCDALAPNQAAILTVRAVTLYAVGRFEEALSDNRRAYALDPQNPYIRKNLGHCLMRLGRYEEALTWLDSAIALRPDFVEALNNKAGALTELHRVTEAASVYGAALALDPDRAETTWNLGLLQLLMGNFEAGFAAREARFKLPSGQFVYPKLPQRLWLGEESVAGKTILVYADEGLGDTIQFARYIPLLAARGARVILAVEPPLRSLMAGVAGVAECLTKPVHALPPFDLHCPMGSLPLAFKTRLDSIPPGASYLPAPAVERVRAWEQRLGAHDRLRVGLVSGNPEHQNDHNRSLPFRALAPILGCDAAFVSLQKYLQPDDQAFLRTRPEILDMTSDLTDFADTAALVSCLDLVISVDTAVVHLGGAMGRPTWVLLPYTPDCRWLLNREDSPWYPSVRLFRQDTSRDYASVVERMRAALAELVAARP
jgi:tetratricopeptide (TPR) repeat protein